MLTAALSLMVAVAPLVADTVVPVDRGVRLHVANDMGSVSIESWDRAAVRVRTTGGPADVSQAASIVRVRSGGGTDFRRETGMTITVPRWMDVQVHGQRGDVRVLGTQGEVAVETLAGSILVDGGAERVIARSLQGGITVRNARGRVEARAVNQSITLENVAGDISAETTNGSIALRGMRSRSAHATTVNGSVAYDGAIDDSGHYAFKTHNGGITVAVPPEANATISAASYHGAFRSDFPVQLTGTAGNRHHTFTLGAGHARVELESFNGDIRLRRPR